MSQFLLATIHPFKFTSLDPALVRGRRLAILTLCHSWGHKDFGQVSNRDYRSPCLNINGPTKENRGAIIVIDQVI